MTWYMPSYGRPERLRELLEAPGGWPAEVVVLINEDDPQRNRYFQVLDALRMQARERWMEGTEPLQVPWRLVGIAPGSRCADAHRAISMRWPDEPWYGLLCDDQWPVTPGWHHALVDAAGDRCISTPAGEPLFPRLRNALVIGGELARAMGSLVPAPVKHNYEDNIWDQIAEDFGCLRPLPDVVVEHRHWVRGEVARDATYERGSSDIDTDRVIFESWLRGAERAEMQRRIAPLFGSSVSTIDAKSIRLVIATPVQDEQVDIVYHKSLNATLVDLANAGVPTKVVQVAGASHVGKARERLLWQAMRLDPTHILWIDADMGWETSVVRRLLCASADHDFCAVAGLKKQDEIKFCLNLLPEQRLHARTHFLEVRDVGFAFVMLKVDVIRRMCVTHPDLRYDAGNDEEYALFLDMIDKSEGPHGQRLSEDLSFCRRWRAIGGEIWVDPHSTLIHAGRKEYAGALEQTFVPPAPTAVAA